MNYIDTHTHLDGEEFVEDLDLVVARAKEAGASKLFIPGINLASVESVKSLCEKYDGYCYGMIGLHPEDVKEDYQQVLDTMEQELREGSWSTPSAEFSSRRWIAIGEIGLDYYWSREFEKEQLLAFEKQVEWAMKYDLSLMIHCRKAQNEMVKCLRTILANNKDAKLRGVFHCFTGNELEAKELLDFENFYLGIGGVLTFKKSKLPETLANAVPLTRIVLETDSPYMAPTPNRGKRNEPAYVVNIIEKLAEVYSTTSEEVARITTENAERMFL